MQMGEGRHQPPVDLARDRDVHRGGEDVVRGLAAVAMVVRVHRRLAAAPAPEPLVGEAGDDLVGVHVRLRARTGLPDDERELVVVAAVDHLGGRGGDGLGHLRIEPAEILVHQGGRLLDEAEGVDERRRHVLGADLEVLDRALGLRAPIPVRRDLDRPEGVGFRAGGGPSLGLGLLRRHRGLYVRCGVRPTYDRRRQIAKVLFSAAP